MTGINGIQSVLSSVMLVRLWRCRTMCILMMPMMSVAHYAINLILCEMTLLAMPMLVKAMLALLHVLVHLLIHSRMSLWMIYNHITTTMNIMNVIVVAFNLNLVVRVVMLIYIIVSEACNCAEDHHSDYHHAFECCFHILYLL